MWRHFDKTQSLRRGPKDYEYDLVVIGSGPAGEKGAAQAAWLGKRVAVVEKQRLLGGACVNTGTLPSKTLRETALYLSGFRQRNLYGVSVELQNSVGVADLMCRQEPVRGHEIDRIQTNIDEHQIELFRGSAQFVDEHTILVEGLADGMGDAEGRRLLTTDAALIATGSTPFLPPHIPFGDPDIDDSDSILSLDRIPATMIILGAGVIGCEYASIFAALGVRVTLVESRERLLSFLDVEIADLLVRSLRQMGVDVVFHADALQIEKRHGKIHALLSTGRELVAEKLLSAAGRQSNTAHLGLDKIGVRPGKRGILAVDDKYRVPGTRGGRVYAAGDVIGFPALASTSMEQARVAMCHAFQFAHKTKVSEHLPYGLYTIPEVSMVGETEESAARKGIDYTVGRARYGGTARGQIIGDLDGMLKLVFASEDRRLLGVHIVGERATELVHVGQMVIHFGGVIDDFIDNVFNYPTLGDLYKTAAYNGLSNLARRRTLEAATG